MNTEQNGRKFSSFETFLIKNASNEKSLCAAEQSELEIIPPSIHKLLNINKRKCHHR